MISPNEIGDAVNGGYFASFLLVAAVTGLWVRLGKRDDLIEKLREEKAEQALRYTDSVNELSRSIEKTTDLIQGFIMERK